MKKYLRHYVYLYRDINGTPLYVGYGRDAQRALDHAKGSHNRRLMAVLLRGKYSLEIAGPFGSRATGLAVESSLISSLEPRFNIQPGQRAFRFRPLGFPAKYYDRTIAPELSRHDFIQRQGRWPTPVIFVYISRRRLDRRGEGFNPATPPKDAHISKRVMQWWALGKLAKKWAAKPEQSPGLLVALGGSPQLRYVVASMQIDQTRWDHWTENPGVVSVSDPRDLDYCGLRGHRVRRAANLKFGRGKSNIYIVMDCHGKTLAGGGI